MDALTALLRAHVAAAQAWRDYMTLRALSMPCDVEFHRWTTAERELTRVLEAGHG